MKIGDVNFNERTTDGLKDENMRKAVRDAQTRLQTNYRKAADSLGDWERWRELGKEIREHTLENLDYYLKQLRDEVSKRGGHVYFAKTKKDANEYVQRVAKEKEAKK